MSNLKGVVSVVAELKNQRTHLKQQLDQLDEALVVLGRLNGGSPAVQPKRTMSIAARRRIAAAQRARWAKVRAGKK